MKSIFIFATQFIFLIPAFAVSYDCSKATFTVEKVVCGNPSLSTMDDQLALAYKNARASSSNLDQLKSDQIAWIKSHRLCEANVACIENSYKARIAALGGGTSTAAAKPAPAAPAASPAPQGNSMATAATSAPAAASTPPVKSKWDRYLAGCEEGVAKGKMYAFDYYDVYSGELSPTRISIEAKGKIVCIGGAVGTGKSDVGNQTIVEFENGGIVCTQTTDQSRLAVEKLYKTGYKIAGAFDEVVGKSTRLKNCTIQKM